MFSHFLLIIFIHMSLARPGAAVASPAGGDDEDTDLPTRPPPTESPWPDMGELRSMVEIEPDRSYFEALFNAARYRKDFLSKVRYLDTITRDAVKRFRTELNLRSDRISELQAKIEDLLKSGGPAAQEEIKRLTVQLNNMTHQWHVAASKYELLAKTAMRAVGGPEALQENSDIDLSLQRLGKRFRTESGGGGIVSAATSGRFGVANHGYQLGPARGLPFGSSINMRTLYRRMQTRWREQTGNMVDSPPRDFAPDSPGWIAWQPSKLGGVIVPGGTGGWEAFLKSHPDYPRLPLKLQQVQASEDKVQPLRSEPFDILQKVQKRIEGVL